VLTAARSAVLSAVLSTAGLPLACQAAPARLHVPSPDWRDQVLYFVMTDRFADGDPSNNDQGAGEFKAGDATRYNGGDLLGLRQRLDYIRGLGATGLWITPPVANQWVDPSGSYTGFHGYWAEHFMQVDRHLGTLADYQALSRALHGKGMVLVQDIVVNHTGNFFSYRDRWNPTEADRAWRGWEPHDQTPPVPRPSQPPFNRNDPRDPAQRAEGIYHWTPDVTDYNDPVQEQTFQMSGLDDLNTDNPVVRRVLRQSYGHWIREVGVDAFRVDTAFYVPPSYFTDFLHGRDPAAPGMAAAARATGRRQFHVFGEGFGIDKPYQDREAKKIDSYMTGPAGQALMPGMLNFPLYGALGDAFARGRPTAELAYRITRSMQLHARPHLMANFVDNHDVDRFLAGGSLPALRQALLAVMSLPGIPVIYYGTEQGFTEQRGAMFAAGFGSGGRDRYDTQAPLYRDIAAMAALRKQHRVLSRGWPQVLWSQAAQAGGVAWVMRTDKRPDKRQGKRQDKRRDPTLALVAFNTADSDALLPSMATGLPAGTVLRGVYGLDGTPPALVVGPGGRVTLRLKGRAGAVWLATAQRQAAAAGKVPSMAVTLEALPSAQVSGDFNISGRAAAGESVQVVVDGDLGQPQHVTADSQGRWQATVDTSRMVDADLQHTVTAWVEGRHPSATQNFQVSRTWQLLADVSDPAGDDTGPEGRYTYPTDASWGGRRQMDLRGVKVWGAGGALRVDVQTAQLTTFWNPPNGFDHVNFTVFIERPGQDGGATVMPLQDSSLPGGMRWHLRLRAGGWSNALFSPEGASATNEGQPVTPGAGLRTDPATQTVRFTLPASALGGAGSLSGLRILVTTWDYDGGYRSLGPTAQPYGMGGGASGLPKVMDASAVITLP
jgi:glycosidase